MFPILQNTMNGVIWHSLFFSKTSKDGFPFVKSKQFIQSHTRTCPQKTLIVFVQAKDIVAADIISCCGGIPEVLKLTGEAIKAVQPPATGGNPQVCGIILNDGIHNVVA